MVFSWLTAERRKRLLAKPLPPIWLEWLNRNVRHYRHLSSRRQSRVRRVARILVAEKHWEGGSGFEVSEEMKVTVAAQAAILVIGLAEPYYFDRTQSIIIYPGPYVHPANYYRRGEIAHGPYSVLGESWYRGPIVLSWRDVLAAGRDEASGHNLVFHEFAHYVDALDGELDGTPPLAGERRQRNWSRVTEAEYLRLVGRARRGEASLLDHYGAANRAEFFAVATECFFEQPHAMLREHRQLYRALSDCYRQDPARWLPDATIARQPQSVGPPPREGARRQRRRQQRLAVLRSGKPGSLFALAVHYFNERRFVLAAAVAGRAIALDPDDGEAFVLRAAARIKQGRYEAAAADASEALRRDADDEDAYCARGAALVRLKDFQAAKKDLDAALKLGCDDAELRFNRGRAWLGLGEPAKAVDDFSRSLAMRPFAAEAYYHRALAHRALGHAVEAKADRARALQLDPRIRRRSKIQDDAT